VCAFIDDIEEGGSYTVPCLLLLMVMVWYFDRDDSYGIAARPSPMNTESNAIATAAVLLRVSAALVVAQFNIGILPPSISQL
jgi:hypothetical protein